jgi:hypothetical protein
MKSYVLIGLFCSAIPAFCAIEYDNIPGPLPGNLPSLGYQANQTAEFGGMITFADVPVLSGATVVMSNWALESTYETVGTSTGFDVPLTLNLYGVGPGDSVGPLLYTSTITALIGWRPEDDPTCTNTTQYRSTVDGICYSGIAQTVTFAIPFVTTAQTIIYGLAFNTETWGYNPIGAPGPYNSLNFGLNNTAPSIGSNTLPGTAYWNTATPTNYADGGTAGVGVFRQDQNWAPYSGAISFAGVPEPSTLVLSGIGVVLVALRKRFLGIGKG